MSLITHLHYRAGDAGWFDPCWVIWMPYRSNISFESILMSLFIFICQSVSYDNIDNNNHFSTFHYNFELHNLEVSFNF